MPRQIPDLPPSTLQKLASAHFLISQIEASESDTNEYWPTQPGEKAALSTFCSMVWGVDAWVHTVDGAREAGLPNLSLDEKRAL